MQRDHSWEVGFRIEEVKRLDPSRLFDKVGNDGVQQLVLALSVAFNDFKDVHIITNWLSRAGLVGVNSDALHGQWSGMMVHMAKQVFGIVHEVLKLLKEYELVLKDNQMTALVQRLPDKTRNDWQTLVSCALGSGEAANLELARRLDRVRNNLSFHYYQPKALMLGYRRRFFDDPPHRRTDHAVCSIGTSLEATRFHYADSAVEGGIFNIIGTHDATAFMAEYEQIETAVGNAIHAVILGYIRTRFDPSASSGLERASRSA